MTPEAQRIAIAAACGWSWRHDGRGHAWLVRPTEPLAPIEGWRIATEKDVDAQDVSETRMDPVKDLNVIKEAIATLNDEQYDRYLFDLCGVVWATDPDERDVHEATAAQKAEAFLHAIGKWESES